MTDLNEFFGSCEGLAEELKFDEQFAAYSDWSLLSESTPSIDSTSGHEKDLLMFEPQVAGDSEWDFAPDATNEHLVVPPVDTKDLGISFMRKITPHVASMWLGEDALKKRPLAVLSLCVFAVLLGHALDTQVLPNCPPCRVALQTANSIV
ncbi:MAG: hypothetical protein JXB05_12350 [Myxococcaceae bacterium]|nr:hypothetical protein [Myxococcaceae bacterium]